MSQLELFFIIAIFRKSSGHTSYIIVLIIIYKFYVYSFYPEITKILKDLLLVSK